MKDGIDLVESFCNKKYATGTQSRIKKREIVNKFNKEVVRQVLLGNRVLLPDGLSIEIIRAENDTGRVQPRLGFKYKIKLNYTKLKKEKIRFIPATVFNAKLEKILLNTDFEYKIVTNGYK